MRWRGEIQPTTAQQSIRRLYLLLLLLLLLVTMATRNQRKARGLSTCSGRDGSDGPSRMAEHLEIAIMDGLTAAAPSSLLLAEQQGCAPPCNARPGTGQ